MELDRPDRERLRLLTADALVLCVLLPGLLAAVHFLAPPDLQTLLELDYADPQPLALWTSAYVHADTSHFLDNLVGWLGGAFVAYTLCDGAGERRWFWTTTLAFLTVLPVAVNLLSMAGFAYIGITPPPTRGFSGVAAGYAGFVLVSLLVWLREFYSGRTVQGVLLLAVVVFGLEIFWIYGETPSLVGLLVFASGFALSLGVLGSRGWHVERRDRDLLPHAVRGAYAVLILAFVGVFVYGLFPRDPVDGGNLTNVLAHAAGFLLGAVLSALLASGRLDPAVLASESPRKE